MLVLQQRQIEDPAHRRRGGASQRQVRRQGCCRTEQPWVTRQVDPIDPSPVGQIFDLLIHHRWARSLIWRSWRKTWSACTGCQACAPGAPDRRSGPPRTGRRLSGGVRRQDCCRTEQPWVTRLVDPIDPPPVGRIFDLAPLAQSCDCQHAPRGDRVSRTARDAGETRCMIIPC